MKEKFLLYVNEHKYALLLLAAAFIWMISTVAPLQHIPGPIFGGDLYREKGYTEHILRGGWFFADPTINGEFTYFPWLASLITAILTVITQIPLHKMLIYLPIFFVAIRGLVYYHIGLSIFKEKSYALMLILASLMWNPFDTKMSTNIAHLCALIALWFFLEYIQTPTRKTAILSGSFYGLTALSHGQVFLSYSAMIVCGLILYFAKALFYDKQTPSKLFKEYKHILTMYGIAIIISLAFFGPLIVKYQLHQDNPVANYALNDVSDLGVLFPTKGLLGYFTPSFSVRGIVTLLMISGVIFCALNLKSRIHSITLFLLLGVYLGVSHYIITVPLLDTWFEPWKLTDQYITIFMLLTVFGIKHILTFLPKSQHIKTGAVVFCFILVIPILHTTGKNFTGDQWFKYGAQFDGHTKALYDMGDWVKRNTDADAVFLANDESAFALNALSGSKVVFLRRVHASYFVGIDKRYADGMVMLYGNNPEVQKKLLSQYGVKYLLIDQFLMNYPMIVKEEYADYLAENGVVFKREKVRFDPSTATAPQFDALVVPPQNLTLERFLTPLQPFSMNSQPIAVIYSVQP